ncbi:toxin-antitoxin system, antitoxin component [Kocuria subflava]|uniref:Toxin-antitoxin system, antitoxin component n=1 Tax=Kocuria subflava TaxID=1736139 RepID=A0A846TXF7_9MICC|nr:toxin-antitoxin system, antitoxin component [Kocuria subflava]
MEGRSLSDYLLIELEQLAARPSRAELLARIADRPPKNLPAAEDVLVGVRPAS